MDNGSKEATEVIRLTMDGMQLMLRLSGTLTKELMEFFAALQKKEGIKTSGKQNLKKLLASGSELKVFTIKGTDKFKVFAKEAKEWGVVYSVIKRTEADRNSEIYEVLIKAEDAAKLNRMIEKFGLMASVAVETIKEKERPLDERSREIAEARDIISKMIEPTGQEKAEMKMEDGEVPGYTATDTEDLFVAYSNQSEGEIILNGMPFEERPSVREKIKNIISKPKGENSPRKEVLDIVKGFGKE